jgi:uncharacterized lipoprotein YmbA
MTRALAIVLVALSLGACAGGPTRDEGVATLDALRDAQAACASKGRTLKLKSLGDAQYIDAYACERN